MEVSYHLLHTNTNNQNINNNVNNNVNETNADDTNNIENQIDTIKRKLIADTCNGIQEKTKILNLHNKQLEQQEEPVIENMKAIYNVNNNLVSSIKKTVNRCIPSTPERILDAPDFKNDYCNF